MPGASQRIAEDPEPPFRPTMTAAADTASPLQLATLPYLRARLAYLESIVNGMPDGLLIVNDDGLFTDLNEAAVILLGYTHEEFAGKSVPEIVAAEMEWTVTEFSRLRTDRVWSGVVDLRRKDGTVTAVEARVTTLANGGDRLYVAAVRPLQPAVFMPDHESTGYQQNDDLSQRETEILRLTAAGLSDKQIALQLSISRFTVSKHVSNILQKLGAGSRTEASVRAIRERLI